MPTYTYRCNNCEYQFDIKQRMSDDPLADCPECETDNALRKVMNSVGIVFKGSGFYVTDSRGKKSAATPPASSENGSSAKAEANGSSAKENGVKEKNDSKATDTATSKKSGEKTAVK